MKNLFKEYRDIFRDKIALSSLSLSLLFFVVSLIINYFANAYAYVRKGNWVPDILLDNLPVVHMDLAFTIGTIVVITFISIVMLSNPRKMPFVLKSMALFIITRSLFISLTHIGPSPYDTLSAPSEIGKAFSSGADLFFSGHTGMPFLFALMYWYNKHLRITFFVISILAAIGVLLGHIHYSIDVASAYYITYGTYIIAMRIFDKEFSEFKKATEASAH